MAVSCLEVFDECVIQPGTGGVSDVTGSSALWDFVIFHPTFPSQ